MISHKFKCIFIHIPKCAGTSIESALGHLDGHEGRSGQDHRTIRMVERPVISGAMISSKSNVVEAMRRVRYRFRDHPNENNRITVTSPQYKEYFKFSIVRNPWGRAYSWYKNVIRDQVHQISHDVPANISFSEFLDKHLGRGMLRPQLDWLVNFEGDVPFDYIGKFENLHADFAEICKCLGVSGIELPHRIQGDGADYREFYSNRTREMVRKCYANEIDMFDYRFD